MPDAAGKFKGISIPPLPWQEKEQAEALTKSDAELLAKDRECPFGWGPDCHHPTCQANRDKPTKKN